MLAPAARAQDEEVIDPGLLAQIDASLPTQATATPQAPRKVFVFTACTGYKHKSIPVAAKAFEMLGAKTGAFTAFSSADPAMFAAEPLAQFDAVIMDNCTGEPIADLAQRMNLVDFVKNGKGIVGVHAATDCFYNWAEYGDMMGGYFDLHPWNSGDTVGVKLDDPAHPLVAAFNGQNFKIKDEIYQFKEPYSREKLRVLLSLDNANTDMDKGDLIHRTDGDFAISWVRSYGNGRVFYCSLGHNSETFANPLVLRHYLDGIQFACGDLQVDTTPSAALSAEYVAQSKAQAQQAAVDGLLGQIAQANYGQNVEAFEALAQIVNTTAEPEAQKPLAEKLVALINADATPAAKQFASEQLSLIGGDESVPALTQALGNPATFDVALYALGRMPAPAAEQAVIGALASADAAHKVSLLNVLGLRHSAAAVATIAPLVADADVNVAQAAIAALGEIPSPEAAQALVQAKAAAPAGAQLAVSTALLNVADRFRETGETKKAAGILTQLYAPTEPLGIRLAAFKGLVSLVGGKGSTLVAEVLRGSDETMKTIAIEYVPEIPGEAATQELAARLPEFAPAIQASLIEALAARGDKAALPAITQAAASPDEAVRIAALKALSALSDPASVAVLATAAAERTGAEANAAAEGLDRLTGPGIDQAILAALEGQGAPATRAQLARSLGARRTPGAVPALLKAAGDPDENVRAASVESLAVVASREDMPMLVALLANASAGKVREAAEKAVASAAERTGAKAGDVIAALPSAQADPVVYSSFVKVLGRIGDDASLPAVREAVNVENPDVKGAAVRALAEWPTPAPLNDLLTIAGTATDESLKTIALQGFLGILTLPSNRPSAETLALYEQGMALATTPEQKKLAIAGLSDVRDPRVVDVLQPYANDPAFEAEAKAALDRLAKVSTTATASDGPDSVANALDGKADTRWSTGTDQKAGQWFQLDLGWEKPVARVTLDTTGSPGDYPRGYEVYVTSDPAQLGAPVATGAGAEGQPVTAITFPAKTGRFVRIVQTGEVGGTWWSIHEIGFGE
jgi:type 1 glutamine amidotransferase/HEAT repeat protein